MNGTQRTGMSISETFQDFWRDGPVRPMRGGKVAGVCAGLGLRYGIDPVIFRVAFVVGALYGGAGVALYLLCWLLFPKDDDATARGSIPPVLVILLLLLLMPALMVSTVQPFGLVGLLVGLLGLYLLHTNYRHRRVDQRPAGTPGPPPDESPTVPRGGVRTASTGTTETSSSHASAPASEPTAEEPAGGQQPPNWDPLGAAPFAWDLPEPEEPTAEEPERPNQRWITLSALAVAALVGAFAWASDLDAPSVLAIPLGVLGVGMLVGSFVGGGRGLIGAAIPLGALAMILNVVPAPPPPAPALPSASVVETPSSVSEVEPSYTLDQGRLVLQLNQLPMTPNTKIETGANVHDGVVRVAVPTNADVLARCSVHEGSVGGNVPCAEGDPQAPEQGSYDVGPDGPGGGQIVLNLEVNSGAVEVFR